MSGHFFVQVLVWVIPAFENPKVLIFFCYDGRKIESVVSVKDIEKFFSKCIWKKEMYHQKSRARGTTMSSIFNTGAIQADH